MRRHYTAKQRSELVELVKVGGATVCEAAARLGVTSSTAYNWMRTTAVSVPEEPAGSPRARSTRTVTAPVFARVVPSREIGAGIVVQVGGAEIHVRREFDADLLCAVVEALRRPAA
jgi:transposase-like protein